jgi:hypothetical protein
MKNEPAVVVEQTKLTATFFNNLAVTCATVGVFAPMFTLVYNPHAGWSVPVGVLVYALLLVILFHGIGRACFWVLEYLPKDGK